MRWATRVVDGLRGAHQGLEVAFDKACQSAIEEDEDYYDSFDGRGQDDQDRHDLANNLLPRERDLPPVAKTANPPPKAK